jgi:hypothetical protein
LESSVFSWVTIPTGEAMTLTLQNLVLSLPVAAIDGDVGHSRELPDV